MITKAERAELRSIVRQQFKVLRAEVVQRQAELLAEVDQEIADRYAEVDGKWAALEHRIQEITLEANRQANDALRESGYQLVGGTERMWFDTPRMNQPVRERGELRHQASTRISAQVKGAMLRLDREEADLLRRLAVDAIESEAARAFLASIPTVGDLVAGARLAELEAQFKEKPG